MGSRIVYSLISTIAGWLAGAFVYYIYAFIVDNFIPLSLATWPPYFSLEIITLLFYSGIFVGIWWLLFILPLICLIKPESKIFGKKICPIFFGVSGPIGLHVVFFLLFILLPIVLEGYWNGERLQLWPFEHLLDSFVSGYVMGLIYSKLLNRNIVKPEEEIK